MVKSPEIPSRTHSEGSAIFEELTTLKLPTFHFLCELVKCLHYVNLWTLYSLLSYTPQRVILLLQAKVQTVLGGKCWKEGNMKKLEGSYFLKSLFSWA